MEQEGGVVNEDKDALIYLADVRIEELEAENAKLRELIGYFLRCERCLCDGCPLNEHGACSILDKAEELGIEVGE